MKMRRCYGTINYSFSSLMTNIMMTFTASKTDVLNDILKYGLKFRAKELDTRDN